MAGAAKRWNKLQGMLQQAGHEKTLKKLGQALNEYLVARFQKCCDYWRTSLCLCVFLHACRLGVIGYSKDLTTLHYTIRKASSTDYFRPPYSLPNLSARLSVDQKTQVKLLLEEGFFSSDSQGNNADQTDASNSLVLVESQGTVTKASKWKQLSLTHVSHLLCHITMDKAFVSRLTPHNKRTLLYYSLHVAPADSLPNSSSSSAVAASSNNPKCYESSSIWLPLLI